MEAYVNMTGYVGGDVELRGTTAAVASFRLACTPRIRRGGDWVDGETTWITVACFRKLAEHVAASVGKGDPVVVVGKLRTTTLQRDGVAFQRLTLEAYTVGHDLSRGTAVFSRVERAETDEQDREADLNAVLASVEEQALAEAAPEGPETATGRAA